MKSLQIHTQKMKKLRGFFLTKDHISPGNLNKVLNIGSRTRRDIEEKLNIIPKRNKINRRIYTADQAISLLSYMYEPTE